MANFGGFLNALGQAFGGYAQDQQIQQARAIAAQKMATEQQAAQDQHLDALLARTTNYPLASSGAAGGTPPSLPPGPPGTGNPSQMPTQPGTGAPPTAGSPSGAPPTMGSMGAMGLPSAQVNVPGYGTVDPYGKYRLQLTLDQIKRKQETDEAIRKANETGETAKNTHEAKRLQPGDPGYVDMMGQVAGAEAKGRLPSDILKAVTEGNISLENGKQLAAIRANVELQLQKNQQDFETGKITQQQKFEKDQAANRATAEFLNHVGETDYAARGTITGRILPRPEMPTQAPSANHQPPTTSAPAPAATPPAAAAPPLPPLTPAQKLRMARDPDYAAFKKSQGYP